MIEALGVISAEPTRLVRRFPYARTSPRRRSRGALDARCRTAGDARMRSAPCAGILPGASATRLLIGSHIDTVVDAGRYDGIFGVVAGILAAAPFRAQRKASLPFSTRRAGVRRRGGLAVPDNAGVIGGRCRHFRSRAARAGRHRRHHARAMRIARLRQECRRAFAASPTSAAMSPPMWKSISSRGRCSRRRNQPLGVVTAIAGQTYFTIEFAGEAGHAGTVPMTLAARRARRRVRDGALRGTLGARISRRSRGDRRPSVGDSRMQRMSFPRTSRFTLDLRTTSDDNRALRSPNVSAPKRARSPNARQLRPHDHANPRHAHNTVRYPPAGWTCCGGRQRSALRRRGCRPAPVMTGRRWRKLCPVGMLFVRCRGGVSHNPAEYASPRDMGLAVAALIEFIARFDPTAFAQKPTTEMNANFRSATASRCSDFPAPSPPASAARPSRRRRGHRDQRSAHRTARGSHRAGRQNGRRDDQRLAGQDSGAKDFTCERTLVVGGPFHRPDHCRFRYRMKK